MSSPPFFLSHRFNSDLSKYCDIMFGEQRTGVRHVGAARPQVLPDTTHGTSGPQGRFLEAPRVSGLGSQTGKDTAPDFTFKLNFWDSGCYMAISWET